MLFVPVNALTYRYNSKLSSRQDWQNFGFCFFIKIYFKDMSTVSTRFVFVKWNAEMHWPEYLTRLQRYNTWYRKKSLMIRYYRLVVWRVAAWMKTLNFEALPEATLMHAITRRYPSGFGSLYLLYLWVHSHPTEFCMSTILVVLCVIVFWAI